MPGIWWLDWQGRHHCWQASPKPSLITELTPLIPVLGRWMQGQQGSGVLPEATSPPLTCSWEWLPLLPRSVPAPLSSLPSDSGGGECPHLGHPLPHSPRWWYGPWWGKKKASITACATWSYQRGGPVIEGGPATGRLWPWGALLFPGEHATRGARPHLPLNWFSFNIFILTKVIGPRCRKLGEKKKYKEKFPTHASQL